MRTVASDPFLDDQTSTVTVYEGSRLCRACGAVLTPIEVYYNDDLCTPDKRRAQRRLVSNKRVGAL